MGTLEDRWGVGAPVVGAERLLCERRQEGEHAHVLLLNALVRLQRQSEGVDEAAERGSDRAPAWPGGLPVSMLALLPRLPHARFCTPARLLIPHTPHLSDEARPTLQPPLHA